MDKISIKTVTAIKCRIHPDAMDAFKLSSQLSFQLTPLWSDDLLLAEINLPWAIWDDKSKKYFVFAHWQSLLHQRNTGDGKIKLLVWNKTPKEVESIAIRFVALILDQSVNRKRTLKHIEKLITRFPNKIKSLLTSRAGLSSSKSLTSYYTGEARSAVRTQCKKPTTKKAGGCHDS